MLKTKFRCENIQRTLTQELVTLAPIAEHAGEWSMLKSPTGQISFTLDKPEAMDRFKVGRLYSIEITDDLAAEIERRRCEEARRIEEAKKLEDARQKKLEEQKRAEEAKRIEEARKLEESKRFETKKLEEQKRADEQKKAEEAKKLEKNPPVAQVQVATPLAAPTPPPKP